MFQNPLRLFGSEGKEKGKKKKKKKKTERTQTNLELKKKKKRMSFHTSDDNDSEISSQWRPKQEITSLHTFRRDAVTRRENESIHHHHHHSERVASIGASMMAAKQHQESPSPTLLTHSSFDMPLYTHSELTSALDIDRHKIDPLAKRKNIPRVDSSQDEEGTIMTQQFQENNDPNERFGSDTTSTMISSLNSVAPLPYKLHPPSSPPPPPSSSSSSSSVSTEFDSAALRRLAERRERLARLRQRSLSMPESFVQEQVASQPTDRTLESTPLDESKSEVMEVNDRSHGRKQDIVAPMYGENETAAATHPTKGGFDGQRCRQLNSDRAKYHYGGGLDSPLKRKARQLEKYPLLQKHGSPQALEALAELGRTVECQNGWPFLPTSTSFGSRSLHSPSSNHPRITTEEGPLLIELNHLMTGDSYGKMSKMEQKEAALKASLHDGGTRRVTSSFTAEPSGSKRTRTNHCRYPTGMLMLSTFLIVFLWGGDAFVLWGEGVSAHLMDVLHKRIHPFLESTMCYLGSEFLFLSRNFDRNCMHRAILKGREYLAVNVRRSLEVTLYDLYSPTQEPAELSWALQKQDNISSFSQTSCVLSIHETPFFATSRTTVAILFTEGLIQRCSNTTLGENHSRTNFDPTIITSGPFTNSPQFDNSSLVFVSYDSLCEHHSETTIYIERMVAWNQSASPCITSSADIPFLNDTGFQPVKDLCSDFSLSPSSVHITSGKNVENSIFDSLMTTLFLNDVASLYIGTPHDDFATFWCTRENFPLDDAEVSFLDDSEVSLPTVVESHLQDSKSNILPPRPDSYRTAGLKPWHTPWLLDVCFQATPHFYYMIPSPINGDELLEFRESSVDNMDGREGWMRFASNRFGRLFSNLQRADL